MTTKMVKIICKIWYEEKLPTQWEEAIFVTLHKKGEKSLCENYRGLSLLNVGFKVLTNIIYRRLFPYYRSAIGNYQAGFLPSKSTIDNIFIARQLCEKYREYDTDSYHLFVDFAQAYDSVHRDSMWNVLRFFLVPEKLVRVLWACYSDTRGKVRIGGQLSEEFRLNSGLKQGCPLSCALFNMALEWVMRQTPTEADPLRLMNGVEVDRLAYADDVDFMGESWLRRDDQMTNFRCTSGRIGLEVKECKTKVMCVRRRGRVAASSIWEA